MGLPRVFVDDHTLYPWRVRNAWIQPIVSSLVGAVGGVEGTAVAIVHCALHQLRVVTWGVMPTAVPAARGNQLGMRVTPRHSHFDLRFARWRRKRRGVYGGR